MHQTYRSFRLSCASKDIPVVEKMLRLQGYAFEPEVFLGSARRLTCEPQPLGSSLAAFFGLIYIQDRASMLPPIALAPAPGSAVLDMCASPGSKTGQLAAMVGEEGLVLGNEPSASRLVTLRRNMGMLNFPQVATCCHKGEQIPLPAASWNHIQLDPPCSGWGTVERNPKVLDIWKEDKVKPLVQLQQSLLREAVRLLAAGGRLVYSTCTTNVEENEEQALFAIRELGLVPAPLPPVEGFRLADPLLGLEGVWRLEPQPGDNQGFFIACFTKPAHESVKTEDAGPLQNAEKAMEFPSVPDAMLLEQGIDPGSLPGRVGIFGQSLHFVPNIALGRLPFSLRWQGMYFGKAGKNGEIRLSPRLRLGRVRGEGIELRLEGKEGLEAIIRMLQGQSLDIGKYPVEGSARGTKSALIVWEGVPLGRAGLKNNRLLWSER